MKLERLMATVILAMILGLTACSATDTGTDTDSGSAADTGGTETGSTDSGQNNDVDTAVVSARIESLASVLVPEINASGAESLSAPFAVTYAEDSLWDEYTEQNNAYILTDVFGSADVEPRVVTKIRVLLEQFAGTMSGIFSSDPDFACTEGLSLDEGDSLVLPYYGEVDNGSADDRYYDCLIEEEGGETTIYGVDASGIVRVAVMSDTTTANAEDVDIRGDQVRILAVKMVAFAETSDDAAESPEGDNDLTTLNYLDLQFAHGTAYNGPDGEFATDDDMEFKSRSRITGLAELDTDGNPTMARGDFNSIKYGKSQNTMDDSIVTTFTKSMGRGGYGDGDVSLFAVESTDGTLADNAGTFCLAHSADSLPVATDTADCADYEMEHAWGDEEFPFTLAPEIDADFSVNAFFAEDDLVDSAGANFTIPEYTAAAVAEERSDTNRKIVGK